ncbi:MAG TPA: DUF3857 domain-containing protein [Acidobacteriaceae bacterium]|nr:DUF3857 domain-containing protein [Acidobacteriaceae bacterium]
MKAFRRRRTGGILSALGLSVLLCTPGAQLAHASKNAQLPDWVMRAAAATGSWGDARAVVLLDDTLLTVDAEGKATERDRMVVKILRPEGRSYAMPAVAFSNDGKLESFHVWSIGPDGHRYAMKDSEYVDVGVDASGEGILYNDERVRTASPPGADPGGIVAWEDTTQVPSYMSEDWWDFQGDIPIADTAFEIDLPPGWHQRAVWSRHEPELPTEVAPNQFRWEMQNVRPINLANVSLAPDWNALAGWMSVHYSANPVPDGGALWAQIGDWYQGLASPQSEGGTDIASEARSIAPGDDFMSKLENVANFMQQQIRYVGIEIGIGNLKPHSAEEVFRNRYGDCKDKATLMIAMLDAVGIRATWVAVDHRRGVVNPAAPSILADHVIIAIRIPAGYQNPLLQAVVTAKTGQRYLIFDPTNQWVPIGQLPDYEQGGYGLLVAGTDSQVIQLPVLNPNLESTDRTANFQLAADGTLTGEVTMQRYGALADDWRDALEMDSEKDQRQLIERFLQNDLSTFTLGTESAENILALEKPLELHYEVTAPLYAKQAGNLLLVRPRVLGSDGWSLIDKPRRYPISFPGVETLTDTFNLRIPPGYTVDDVPDPVNVDAGFATYRSEVKAEGAVLHYQRELVLKQVTLPPSDYAELMKLNAAITTDENSDAVLRKQ